MIIINYNILDIYLGRNIIESGYSTELSGIRSETISVGKYVNDITILSNISECTNLNTIDYYNTTPPNTNEFSISQYMNVKVNIPVGSLQSYKSHSIWGNFRNLNKVISEPEDGNMDVDIDDLSEYPIELFSISGMSVGDSSDNLTPGVYIKRQGDKTEKFVIK